MSGRDRSTFDRLAREGRRSQVGSLWCRYVPDQSDRLVVAFAIPRAVGPAVTRNRLRRRLRALLAGVPARVGLTSGTLLVGARPSTTELTFAELGEDVRRLLASVIVGAPAGTPA